MWFGRSHVQDRAEDSDERAMSTRSPAATHGSNAPDRPTEPSPDGPSDAGYAVDAVHQSDTTSESQLSTDDPTTTEPKNVDQMNDDVALTNTPVEGTAVDAIEHVRRLHEATLETARHSRNLLSKQRARRKLHDALTEEADALHRLGFDSFGAFAAVHGAAPVTGDAESDETIVRIRALLTELGVDSSGDPLQAASEFLTTHEIELGEPEPAQSSTSAPADIDDATPTATASTAAEIPAVEVAPVEVAPVEVPTTQTAHAEVAEPAPTADEPVSRAGTRCRNPN